ncbi:hypothetical protein AYI70_g2980 [Smittium culicis]|uniref:Reverse transcriptase domain-containing protein n=1 Tax=Smittium culicis TaxID=133412 RepID=A0A1R1Y5Y9_9FUNG|nr:hypothetical protein AYI70_g2980 [Smittium culicis]
MLRRVFESMLLDYLNNTPLAKFHPLQAGFRSGYSTLTHIIISRDLFYLDDNLLIPSALLFADDIQLLPKDYNDAARKVHTVENWCKNNKMTINIKKSAYIGPSG